MTTIKTIFDLHEGIKFESSARSRFGSLWKPEDGIILYPPNGNARDYITLLKITVPDIPLILCDDARSPMETVSGLRAHTVSEAASILPHALFVLCATGDKASELFAHVAPQLSATQINNMITFRQIGEFLPVGDRKTRAFDVYRKTFLAASSRNRKKWKPLSICLKIRFPKLFLRNPEALPSLFRYLDAGIGFTRVF